MADGKVLHAARDGVHILRFVGAARYTMGPELERFVATLFAGVPPRGVVVDLREATTLDSTNLGIIAGLAKRMARCGGRRVTVISSREDITELLLSMALDRVLDIVAEDGADAQRFEPVATTGDPQEEPELDTVLLKAHRTLTELSGENRERFEQVVAALESQRGG